MLPFKPMKVAQTNYNTKQLNNLCVSINSLFINFIKTFKIMFIHRKDGYTQRSIKSQNFT